MNNFSILLLEKVFSLSLAMAISILIARFYGVEASGTIQTVVSFCFIFKFIAMFGVNQIVLKDVAESEINSPVVVLAANVYTILFILYFVIGVTVMKCIGYTDVYIVVFCIMSLGVYLEKALIYQAYFQAAENFFVFCIASLAGYFLSFCFVFLCIVFDLDLVYVSFYYAVQMLLMYLILRFKFSKIINSFSLVQPRQQIIDLLKRSWPLAISAAVYTLYMKIDIVMIDRLLGAYQAGLYSAAVKIIMPLSFLGVILSQLYFKKMANAYASNRLLYRSLARKIVWQSRFFAVITFSFMYFFGAWLINIIYGENFEASADVAKVLSLCFLVIFSANVFAKMLLIEGLFKFELIKTSVACLVNIVMNYFLIPEYGMLGAAFATVLAYFISDLFVYSLFARTRHIFFIYFTR